MKKRCPFCSVEVVTYVEQETNPFFGISALLVLVFFGMLSFLLVPIGYFLTLSAVHRCSRCLQRLGEKSCIGLPEDYSLPVSGIQFTIEIGLAFQTRKMFNSYFENLCDYSCSYFSECESFLRLIKIVDDGSAR